MPRWQPEMGAQLVVVQSKGKGRAVFIKLEPGRDADGGVYSVRTAFPLSSDYTEMKAGWKLLWGGASVPSVASGADPLADSPPDAGVANALTPGQSSSASVPMDGSEARCLPG